jgi:hypothetical protein
MSFGQQVYKSGHFYSTTTTTVEIGNNLSQTMDGFALNEIEEKTTFG